MAVERNFQFHSHRSTRKVLEGILLLFVDLGCLKLKHCILPNSDLIPLTAQGERSHVMKLERKSSLNFYLICNQTAMLSCSMDN
jgi:hypothetical protein